MGLTDGINTNVTNNINKPISTTSFGGRDILNGNISNFGFSLNKNNNSILDDLNSAQNQQSMIPTNDQMSKIMEIRSKLAKQFGTDESNIHIDPKTGNVQILKDQSWFKQNKEGLNIGLGVGQLGLGIASFLKNKDAMAAQIEQSHAQTDVLKEQLKEAKSERDRITSLRAKLSKSY